ncbi:hypothetical protein QF001_003750 [Paraburkholderia youngii]|uniref:hypothetical protein n=1 Tax=Paraburkholderia youngii TaxID=2782701 RepID=UPI003D19BBDA
MRLAQPLLAIDPGPVTSGLVVFDGERVFNATAVVHNAALLHLVGEYAGPVALEMIASYGMAVGREVFETCVWVGRFMQAALCGPDNVTLADRKSIKLHLCGSSRAKDANIRAALLDRFGGKEKAVGKKRAPGPLYGVHSHAWAALAVAVYVSDNVGDNIMEGQSNVSPMERRA